ncbi:hypothetical protein [Lentzea sp. HUAS12]|uniref:hypothetical protein n=1 Tax=Lentzea sp. HUAS12 TaxID=2951806 RepID=UPI00209EEE84|nr:hypothetical protein [Lentzea sp. HUAS12]USX55492.1 hypothetical protein ND450_15745 [Lentzea sp. HUAS12]
MVKKLIAGAALACASLVVVAPAAHAASFAGVYPSHSAASKACKQGVAQGRWYDTCRYQGYPNSRQVGLWVQPR